jgi:hypothetical protein
MGKNESRLINFNVPKSIKGRFDEVCRTSGRTRTSVLLELMENFTLSQGKALIARSAELENVDQALEKIRHITRSREGRGCQPSEDDFRRQNRSNLDSGPPMPLMSDGRDEWGW